jgi:O-antigen ligase
VPAITLVPFAVAGVFGAVGVLLAGGAAAGALVLRDPRRRAMAALAAPVLAALALVTVLHSGTLDELRARAALAGGAAVAGLVALIALTVLFRRYPAMLPVLAVAALPFRVPVVIGSSTANLLLPLYGVIGAGCLAYAWTWLRGSAPEAPADRDPWVRRLEIALAGTLLIYCVQTLYSDDIAQATKNVCFFYVPFAVLFRLLLDTPWTPRRLRWAFGVTVGLAVVFALIGFAEFATGRLLLTNTKVLEANELKPYFRVNSLFFDPNIYGRYLALTMVLLAAVLLWTRRGRDAALIGGALAVLWAGLVLSLSQSSFASLLAGLAALAVLRWRGRIVITIAAVGLAAAIALVVFAPGLLHIQRGGTNVWDRATSGRVELVQGAADMFRQRPLLGYGSGAFQAVYRKERHIRSTKVPAVSHTIPLTIAAEQGILGLLVYAWLLVTAGALLFGGRLRAQVRRASPGIVPIARTAVAAAACALVLHTLIYASFLEDPLLWTLLAIGAALRAESDATAPDARARAAARSGAALT